MEYDTLYKYGFWKKEHHPERLLKNELFFSSPKDMNDPFDLKITQDFSQLDSAENVFEFIKNLLSPEMLALIEKDPSLKDAFHPDRFLSPISDTQKNHDKLYCDSMDKHLAVLCFSQAWDSVLMWSHYSDNHSGFCLAFHKTHFVKSHSEGGQGQVEYGNYPRINPLKAYETSTIIEQCLYKAPGWIYENEYRFIKIRHPEHFPDHHRLLTYPDHFLKEIILGMVISEDDKRAIIKEGLKKRVPIYQIEKVPLSFDITRRQLTETELAEYK